MSFYVDKDYKIVEFFESWIDFISGMNINNPNGGDTREMYRSTAVNYRMNYPTTYKGPIISLNLKRTYLINRCHMNLLMLST